IKVGVISSNGRFVSPEKGNFPEKIKKRLVLKDEKLCFEVSDGVYLTQKDIRQVQLAKGAVRSGVEALLASKNVEASQVDLIQIAGSFGYHLRAKSLIHIGLLPKEFEDKIEFVGNTSKTGGNAFLLNTSFRSEMKKLVEKVEVVELANQPGFDNLFVKCLSF
ncbi:MAG: DUF4445 domain-containing protein, partial [Pyrinomonadaceae bacterium]|nr:DUF4445 domain-containing protein [Sphingobacteriaceae bacterium]